MECSVCRLQGACTGAVSFQLTFLRSGNAYKQSLLALLKRNVSFQPTFLRSGNLKYIIQSDTHTIVAFAFIKSNAPFGREREVFIHNQF
jgi:hypothetical protein